MQTMNPGSYLEIDATPAVRFERAYPHPIERVWRAITEPAELRHWFPSPEVSHDALAGGAITLAGDPYNPQSRTSTILVWDPPRRFGFEWEGDQLFFTLTPDGGGCHLELLNLLTKVGAAARNAAGWEMCLDQLALAVDGHPGGGAHEGDLSDFTPVLERYKSAGLPDDGWLPDEPQASD